MIIVNYKGENKKVLFMTTAKKIDPYLQQKVLSASPAQLVLYVYDIATVSYTHLTLPTILRV